MRERHASKMSTMTEKLQKAKRDLAVALNIEVSPKGNQKVATPVGVEVDFEEVSFAVYIIFGFRLS